MAHNVPDKRRVLFIGGIRRGTRRARLQRHHFGIGCCEKPGLGQDAPAAQRQCRDVNARFAGDHSKNKVHEPHVSANIRDATTLTPP